MDKFKNKSPYLYTAITLTVFTVIIIVFGKIDSERLLISTLGLVGSGALLTASFFLPKESKCEHLIFRFLALQSACVGVYLWGSGLEISDVKDWIVGFMFTIFILLPLLFMFLLSKISSQ